MIRFPCHSHDKAPLLLALLLGVALGLVALPRPAHAADPAVRAFDITYRTVVRPPEDAGRVRIWIPYPHDTPAQEVEVLSVDAPYPVRIETEPEYGNVILYLEADHPKATEIPVEIHARVHRHEELARDLPPGDSDAPLPKGMARWLEPDRLVPIDGRISDLAKEVTAGKTTELARARAIYDYVVDTMSYDKSGEGWGHGDIYWACDIKRGNCTDFHALFTGLDRAIGIPARFSIGLPIPADRGEGTIGGYHCWASFYLQGYGWVPVDASEAKKHPEKREYFFGAHDENRVELSRGRDVVLKPKQDGEPLNFFVYPYVEVDGKSWAGVDHSFQYRDLDAAQPAPAAAVVGSGAGP